MSIFAFAPDPANRSALARFITIHWQVSTIPLPIDSSAIKSFARELELALPAVLTKETAISVLITLAFQRSGVLNDLLRVQVGETESLDIESKRLE